MHRIKSHRIHIRIRGLNIEGVKEEEARRDVSTDCPIESGARG